MVEQTKTGRAYWRSLDDLTQTPEFREMMSKEFADYAPEQVIASPSRRGFMKLMAASMALAGGVAGCRRWPEQEVLPYAERPEGHIPGTPERFATVMEMGGVARPLLVSSFDYRPTKAEGNPSHPQSGGATDVFAQASLLTMYDPARSRQVKLGGERSSWRAFEQGLRSLGLRESGGAGLAILSDATDSPTVGELRRGMAESMPQARWFEYEPINRDHEVEGARLAFGRPLRPHLNLEEAKVIATLDADVLGTHPASLRYARQWAKGRRPANGGAMSRLWSVDSRLTVTSSNADRRLALPVSRIPAFVRAVAAEVGVGDAREELSEEERAFASSLASDLKSGGPRSILAVGPSQPPETHAMVWRVNARLGNLGRTVTFTENPGAGEQSQASQIASLTEAMKAGQVRTLLILGGNPVYNAPADLGFAEALANVENTVHLSEYADETSARCDIHLPRSHYLECWRDARAWDGTVSIQQPLIRPLYDTRSDIEVLAMVLGDELGEGYGLVRRTFAASLGSRGAGSSAGFPEKQWRQTLHDGLLADSGYPPVEPGLQSGASGTPDSQSHSEAASGANELELVFTTDYSVYDGRFAENGWLQELPDPMTKVTWDNAALVSPATAKNMPGVPGGVWQNDLIRIRVGDRAMDAAVFIMPGQAPRSISVALGYGRSEAGYIGTGVGFDAYQVRTGDAMHVAPDVRVEKLGRRYPLVSTQNHYAIDRPGMEEREQRAFGNLVRTATLDHYHEHPRFAEHMGPHTPTMKTEDGVVPLQIWQEPEDWQEGHQWGMAIDLSTCIGCSACVIACQAENNVPIVGKEAVAKGREMHWIRVDRYFGGDPEAPHAVHQPVACHHCETAPCEAVCPVAATVHDAEGLNVMIYNRCIGTRYCSNNCPYKVRRFNWFDWHYKPVKGEAYTGTYLGPPDQQQLQIDPIRQMQFNPEVTVRMRGVMEKCTFCVQRIKAATIPARNAYAQGERETDLVEDGEITPACAQVCPTEAITFGNLSDPDSRVAQQYRNPRAYEMLKELNVRARNRYLAQITNPGDGGGGPRGPASAEPAGGHGSPREEHG